MNSTKPMRSYLDLAGISAKVHRRQSRMTRICIVLAVFLVTAIFAMADMELQNQTNMAIQSEGNWHVASSEITAEQAALIALRPDIAATGLYAVQNYGLDGGYSLGGKPLVLCGGDAGYLNDIAPIQIAQGRLPQTEQEIALTVSVQQQLGAAVGQTVTLTLPDGSVQRQVVGFIKNTSMLAAGDAFGAVLTLEGDLQLCGGQSELTTFLRFTPGGNWQDSIADIEQSYGLPDGSLKENARLMTLSFQSSNSYFRGLYGVAAVLFVLVMLAGVLMIAGTLSSSITSRTAFFGMLRCLGATRRQVMRYVRREALQWCVTAIPIGLVLGSAVTWGLCALLRTLSPYYFAGMPLFGLSSIALGTGALAGFVTVLAAARTPAKRAAAVSPLTAVSGNAVGSRAAVWRTGRHIEVSLGIHHATAAKKNLLLVVGSFAISIVLFLAFSAALDFMHHAFRPLRPYTPDLSVVSVDNTCSLPAGLGAQIVQNPAVKRVYGRSFAYRLPAVSNQQTLTVNLISYEQYQYGWAQEELLAGEIDTDTSNMALTVYDPEGTALAVGDSITLPGGAVTVSGLLSTSPFDREEGVLTVIVNETTFAALTGQSDYTIFDVQLTRTATDADVAALRALAPQSATFSDQRQSNREVQGAYLAVAIFFYGFEVVITLIAVLNILNSIGMSVTARTAQYGAMRAIGLDFSQLRRMLLAEAVTYAVLGGALGAALGLPLHRVLYTRMVTSNWGTPWQLPAAPMALILALVLGSALLAVRAPLARLRRSAVVETLSAQ